MPEHDWKQHFPTYQFYHRDIVLKEYESAAKTLETAERLFVSATNITVVVTAALGSLAVGSLDKLIGSFSGLLSAELIGVALVIMVVVFSITTVRYFADRHKAILFASRKVVVLRRMLGLSFGSLQLVLPNWRTEGADEPFALRLFPGWSASIAYPYWIVATFSSAILLLLFAKLLRVLNQGQVGASLRTLQPLTVAGVFVWVGTLAFVYRRALYDTHERVSLSVAKTLATILRLRLVGNFEHVIYRAKLATFETARMHVQLDTLKEMLIFVEDRTFFEHHGVSLRALGRAVLGLVGLKRRSGGSTITQQVVRTLFIENLHQLVRRKCVELLLALWFERVTSKAAILELYLSSVRFAKGVFGVTDAMRFFFGRMVMTPTKAQAFFLVERVSNVRPAIILSKLDHTVQQAVDLGKLEKSDARELMSIYSLMIDEGKLQATQPAVFRRLVQKWSA